VVLKTLERLDMEPFYKGPDEYTAYARELNDEARQQVEQLGLKSK
jgi:hypothetical protein